MKSQTITPYRVGQVVVLKDGHRGKILKVFAAKMPATHPCYYRFVADTGAEYTVGHNEIAFGSRLVIEDRGRSICLCGHSGDVSLGETNNSYHAGAVGHGRCGAAGCSCQQFTWKCWAPWYVDVAQGAAS